MVKKKRPNRLLKKTLLLVGEGEAEKAFIQHLNSLYGTGKIKIKIKSAGGKGPNNVINDTINTQSYDGYDRAASLLDTDIPWPAALVKRAHQLKIELIGSEPCLEGFLLKILQQPLPSPLENNTCKKKLHPQLCGKETEKESYQVLFTKQLLDERAKTVKELKSLIDLISGK